MIPLLLLSVAGWTAILTRGAGPWNIIARLRAAWPAGPMGCPLCCGTWVGAAAGLAYTAEAHYPAARLALTMIAGAGAGALVSELYARALELGAELAYLARQRADAIERAQDPDAGARAMVEHAERITGMRVTPDLIRHMAEASRIGAAALDRLAALREREAS